MEGLSLKYFSTDWVLIMSEEKEKKVFQEGKYEHFVIIIIIMIILHIQLWSLWDPKH